MRFSRYLGALLRNPNQRAQHALQGPFVTASDRNRKIGKPSAGVDTCPGLLQQLFVQSARIERWHELTPASRGGKVARCQLDACPLLRSFKMTFEPPQNPGLIGDQLIAERKGGHWLGNCCACFRHPIHDASDASRGPLLAIESLHLYKPSVTRAAPILAFATPKGAGPDEEPCASLCKLLEAAGICCLSFAYEPARSDAQLVTDLRGEIRRQCHLRQCQPAELIVGGFSRGARIAAMLAMSEPFCALLCLSYPFHKRGAPKEQHGLEALRLLTLPTLILQGTRDAHGNREQVRGYKNLPPGVRLHWLEDGNHRWQPPAATGATSQELIRSAVSAVVTFLQGNLSSASDV